MINLLRYYSYRNDALHTESGKLREEGLYGITRGGYRDAGDWEYTC